MADLTSIGASATQVYRQALATVSNNIANLNTEGYSRQEAVTTDNSPTQQGVHYIGSGSRLVAVQRNYDQFVEGNLRQSQSQLSAQTPMVDYSSRILDIMGDDSSSLTSALDRFFESTNKLSVDPASSALRGSLLSAGDYLASRTRDIAGQLADVREDSAAALESAVSKLNTLTEQLAKINVELAKNNSLERQPPALLDQRDKLLRDMAGLAGLGVVEAANGEVEVRLAGSSSGAWLVSRGDARLLDVAFSPLDAGNHAFIVDAYGSGISVAPPTGGELGGLVSFRSEVLNPLVQDIDRFAETFTDAANEVHASGINLENETGLDLFRITPRIVALDARGQLASEVSVAVSAEAEKLQAPLQLTYTGNDQWLLQDSQGGTRLELTGETANGLHRLSIDDLELTFAQLPEVGKSFTLSGMPGSARNMTLALQDAAALAAGGRLVAAAQADNERVYGISFDYLSSTPDVTTGIELADITGRNLQRSAKAQLLKPAVTVATDLEEFAVSIQPPVGSSQHLQLLTADFSHLVGTELTATELSQLPQSGAFKADSRYQAEALNSAENSVFYGFRASQSTITDSIPEQLNQTGGASELIAAGDLALNGHSLPALVLTADATLSAADVASWLNGETATTGVSASAETRIRVSADSLNYQQGLALNSETVFTGLEEGEPGAPEQLVTAINAATDATGVEAWLDSEGFVNLRNTPDAAGANILVGVPAGDSRNVFGWEETRVTGRLRLEASASGGSIAFGFGDPAAGVGHPSDLSRLGLATGVYGEGRRDSPLQIFVSDSQVADAELTLQVGDLLGPAEVTNDRGYTIEFLDDEIYELRSDSGVLLRKAQYDHEAGIELIDARVRFDLQPRSGEGFVISPNLDASGDNRALLAMNDLADQPLLDDMTIAQFYVDQVNKVGTVSQLSQLSREALQVVYDQAEESRARVSGVSLDQEAADLIRFQQAYQAAAQIIQVSTRLFDTILGVGR